MLQQLYIRNYALIREVRLELSSGFSVLTGETGAGKSILLGALGLVLGDRADSSALRDQSEKCIVEALFHAPRLGAHPLAAALDLTEETDWCLRREVTANGKSRAFVNDTPVTLQQLQSFASELVDIHQQFDTLELKESDRQLELMDQLAGHMPAVEDFRSLYAIWRKDQQALKELESSQLRIQQEQEYNLHLLGELEEASFQVGEIEELEEKVRAGGQSEDLTQSLSSIVDKLQGDGENITQQLRKTLQSLSPYENRDDSIRQWADRLRTTELELRELAREMERSSARYTYDPKQLSVWQDRLSNGFRLLKKHGLRQTQELIDLQSRLREQIVSAERLEDQIKELRLLTQDQEDTLRSMSMNLQQRRKAATEPWVKQVNALLFQVGMPTARFGVFWEQTELGPNGTDECKFLLDANHRTNGTEPNWQPVRKVASGGELSRLMLCIKSLLADRVQLPTLIFDEIDTGISGEAAKQVGLLLRALGKDRQVICVTHQPQVAAKGKHHWHVSKTEKLQGMETQVELLTDPERIEALARIIGGEPPTDTARRSAAELLAS